MSHHHGALLRTIFQDPINANIHWREVESLLHHLGAEIETLSGNRVERRLYAVAIRGEAGQYGHSRMT